LGITAWRADRGFIAQDPNASQYAGIYVISFDNLGAGMPQVGDIVDIVGGYQEYREQDPAPYATLSQLDVTSSTENASVTITGSNGVITPAEVTLDAFATPQSAEPYESMVVRLAESTPLEAATDRDQYGQFYVANDASTTQVQVDDEFWFMYSGVTPPDAGATFDAIEGPVYFAFGEYKITPIGAAGFIGYTPADDTDTGVDTDTDAGPLVTTIGDLRAGNSAVGDLVKVENAIVVGVRDTGTSADGFAIQDQAGGTNAGIWVYTFTSFAGNMPSVGDVVDVTGDFNVYNGLDQINAANGGIIDVTGTGTVPAPVDVSINDINGANASDYQSMLVRLTEGADRLEVQTAPDQFGNFEVNSAATATTTTTDSLMYDFATATPGFGIGDTFNSLTGILYVRSNVHRVAPRDANDIDDYVAAPTP